MKAIYRLLLNLKWDNIIASIITPSLTQAVSLKGKARKSSPELRRASLPPLLTKEKESSSFSLCADQHYSGTNCAILN